MPFVLNARTDAYLLAGDRDPADLLADAIERGRAFLDAGADCVFVPGQLDAETVRHWSRGSASGRSAFSGCPACPTRASWPRWGWPGSPSARGPSGWP